MLSTINNEIRELTYVEYVKLVRDLQDQERVTEVNTQASDARLLEEANKINPRTLDYRLLPDLDRSIPNFTGCESNVVAND